MATLTPDETILGLLATQKRHGYQLIDIFQDTHQLGRVWKLSTSQLYNVLKRLEREALVIGCEASTESGPPRTEYALSELGQQRLNDWLYEANPSSSIRRIRVEFLSRLFIAHGLNLDTMGITHRQRAACLRERERLVTERDNAALGMDVLAIEFVIEQLDAVLRWMERCCEVVPISD